jgi:hypothetical protein
MLKTLSFTTALLVCPLLVTAADNAAEARFRAKFGRSTPAEESRKSAERNAAKQVTTEDAASTLMRAKPGRTDRAGEATLSEADRVAKRQSKPADEAAIRARAKLGRTDLGAADGDISAKKRQTETSETSGQ